MWVKNIYRFWEVLLSKHFLSQNKYYLNRYGFLKRRIHALVGKLRHLKTDVSVWFPAAIFVPLTWRLHTTVYKAL